jgi:hypothetical protein
MAQVFKALGIDRSCLFAIDGRDEGLERSARNIDRAKLTTVSQLKRLGHPAEPDAAADPGRGSSRSWPATRATRRKPRPRRPRAEHRL